jgi:hypothetical protein
MRKIIAYGAIVEEQGILGRFVEEINKAIKNGWEPFGGISVHENSVYAQTMVKYEEEANEQ